MHNFNLCRSTERWLNGIAGGCVINFIIMDTSWHITHARYQTDNCFNLSCWLLFHHSKNTFSPSTQLKSYIYWEKWYRTIIPHKQSRSQIFILIYDMIIPSKPFVTNILKKNNQGAMQIQLKWKFLQFVNLNSFIAYIKS